MNALDFEQLCGKLFVERHKAFPNVIFHRVIGETSFVAHDCGTHVNKHWPIEFDLCITQTKSMEPDGGLEQYVLEQEHQALERIIARQRSRVPDTYKEISTHIGYRDLFWRYTDSSDTYGFVATLSILILAEPS